MEIILTIILGAGILIFLFIMREFWVDDEDDCGHEENPN